LIGYDAASGPDQPMGLTTYWRVDHTPALPLSIFAHAIDAAGNIVTQRDGLNVRLSTLEPGDLIAQHFDLEFPSAVAALELGVYDVTSGQRMLISQKFDRVRLVWK
jgi:hypothetical protein